jgi:hypothetical protein
MLVNVVLAVEVMWIHLFVVNAFNLNCGVEESILAAAQVRDGGQCFQRLFRLDVNSHREFALRDRPQVHVV